MENTPGAAKATRKAGTRPLSVIIGTLLIPVSALAAYAFVNPAPTAEEPALSGDSAAPLDGLPVLGSGVATPEDLATACGSAGLALVAAEDEATITDVEQAALDALREVCAAQGMPLPSKPAPEPIVEQILVQSPASVPSSSSSSTASSSSHDNHDDDDHDDENDDQDDHDDHDDDEDDD